MQGSGRRLSSGLLCGLLWGLGSGCFSEPAEGTGGSTQSAADTGGDPSGETTDPDSTAGPSGGGCMGCLDAAGGCLAGDLDAACGVLAAACVSCDAESFCDEGQCVALPLCNAQNCEGCCDGDNCLPGTASSACGDNALQCSVCNPESTCNEGSCELPCETTCTGCCDASGDCFELDVTTTEVWGANGETCQGCAPEFACSKGACISTACQSNCDGCCDGARCQPGDSDAACGGAGLSCQACPAGTSCAADACVADADALWQVHVYSATTALTDANGIFWDNGSLPDPYVEVTVAGMLDSTDVANNSATPLWGEILFDSLPTADFAEGMLIELWDSDLTFDESMGECPFSVPPDQFGVPLTAECTDDEANLLWTLQLSIEATE